MKRVKYRIRTNDYKEFWIEVYLTLFGWTLVNHRGDVEHFGNNSDEYCCFYSLSAAENRADYIFGTSAKRVRENRTV